MVINLSELN